MKYTMSVGVYTDEARRCRSSYEVLHVTFRSRKEFNISKENVCICFYVISMKLDCFQVKVGNSRRFFNLLGGLAG